MGQNSAVVKPEKIMREYVEVIERRMKDTGHKPPRSHFWISLVNSDIAFQLQLPLLKESKVNKMQKPLVSLF